MSNNMKDQGITRKLAQFISQLRYQDIPPKVIEKTKEIVLDQLGCELSSSVLPWNKIVYEYAKAMGGSGRSTVVNFGLKTNPEYAALTNATFGHGFQTDDGHVQCLAHPGCVAVPAPLAVGEEHGISGKDYILSVAVACEVILRFGGAAGYSVIERGFHEVSVEGPLGAAAGVGKLLGIGEDKLLNAISIAGSHASGTLEYAQTGGDVKRLHAGIGAVGGIRSALLAQRGLTGPPTILEGKRGLFQAFANTYDASKVIEGLGEAYELLGTEFKRYCAGVLQTEIDGVREIMTKNHLKPEDIEEILVGTNRLGVSHLGSIGPTPKDITGAQFSTHFNLGLTVVKGSNDFKTYMEAMQTNFRDPKVIEIAKKVKVFLDDECDRAFPPAWMCKITIKTRDGSTFQVKVDNMSNPLARVELEEKFMELATVVLPEDKAKRLRGTILSLEKLDNITKLTAQLVA